MMSRTGFIAANRVESLGGGIIFVSLGMLLPLLISSCSPYQEVTTSDKVAMDEIGEVSVTEVGKGNRVRITTKDGQIVVGKVVAASTEAISISHMRNDVEETVSIARKDIAKLEIKVGRRSDIILVLGVLAIFFGILAASYDPLRDLGG